MDVKADHRAAGLGIDINLIDIQGVDGKKCSGGFRPSAVPRRRSLPYQNRCGSERPLPVAPPDRSRHPVVAPGVSAGRLTTTQCHQPEPVGASGS